MQCASSNVAPMEGAEPARNEVHKGNGESRGYWDKVQFHNYHIYHMKWKHNLRLSRKHSRRVSRSCGRDHAQLLVRSIHASLGIARRRFPRRFDDEIVLKAYCIRPVVTRLSQYTYQRIPDGTSMPRFAAADVDRILAGRSGSFYEPANHKIGILNDCSRTDCLRQEAPETTWNLRT